MSWHDWLPFSRVALPDPAVRAVGAWRALRATDLKTPFRECRFVVVDTETTGLDVARAELLSIGACVLVDGQVRVNESFEMDLRPKRLSSAENVLIHEIGHQRQSTGIDPVSALCAFLGFAGKSVLVAHHALFDAAMIAGAIKRHLHLNFDVPWLDVGVLLPALLGERIEGPVELDTLTQRYGASCPLRHNAVSDAYATAQLFLVALQHAELRKLQTVADLMRTEKSAIARAGQRHAPTAGA